MKKLFLTIKCLLCVILVLLLSSCIGPGVADYDEILFGNFQFMRSSSLTHSIRYVSGEEQTEIFSGLIYKYTYDENEEFIAAHCMKIFPQGKYAKVIYRRLYNGTEQTIYYDKYVIYDCSESKTHEFDSVEEFEAFCKENNLVLTNWRRPGGGTSVELQNTSLLADYELCDGLYLDYSSITKNGREIIYGYITDLEIDNKNNTISFRLRQTDYPYDEEVIGTVNLGLSPLNNEAIGKYRLGFLDYVDVYYDEQIVLNTITGEFYEK